MLVDREDAFGLRLAHRVFNTEVQNQRFAFRSSAKQLEAFQQWLQKQVDQGVLPKPTGSTSEGYWRSFVEEGYRKGAGRAFDDTRKPYARGYAEKGTSVNDFYEGTRYEFLRSSFAQPETISKVELLASRTYTDLKGVTSTMGVRMGQTLAQGLAEGQNPRVIARRLNQTIQTLGKNRAKAIAQTEIIRAHAEGQLDSIQRLGIKTVTVMAEWSTAGDDRVCPACEALEGAVMTLREARGIIPRHTNCRCTFLPANVGEKPRNRSAQSLRSAIDTSLRAELPKGRVISKLGRRFRDPVTGRFTLKKGRTLAEQKKISTWPGATKTVARQRPKPFLPEEKKALKLPKKATVGKSLTPAEVKAVNVYTAVPGGESTENLQAILVGKRSIKTDAEKVFAAHFRGAVEKLPTKRATAYRGLAVKDIGEFQVGKFVRANAIDSWTTDQTVAEMYSITGRGVSVARGTGRETMVVLKYKGKYIDPSKVIKNPSGKEVWALDRSGYTVTRLNKKIEDGFTFYEAELKLAKTEAVAQAKIAELESRIAIAKKYRLKKSQQELETELQALLSKNT